MGADGESSQNGGGAGGLQGDRPAMPPDEQVVAFLSELHGEPVGPVEALSGGFWSSAYGYRAGDRELVLRLGTVPEGFFADRAAMAFDGPDLPVPPVFDIGEAFGMSYAVSERRHGRFLEDVEPTLAHNLGPTLARLLLALRTAAPAPPGAPVEWQQGTTAGGPSWRRWLLDGLVDDPSSRVAGWSKVLAADPALGPVHRACERRITELVEACPERRDVVHGDLLHGNVLVSAEATRVNAVFSWKCSVRGDFLYDVAWCTFWGAWHPGIAAAGAWDRVIDDPAFAGDDGGLLDAAVRHHCYELHIGTTHLGWYVWTGDEQNLRAAAAHTASILERGPLSVRPAAGA